MRAYGRIDVVLTNGIETVHHRRYDVQLVLDGLVDKVGVHQDAIRRSKGRIVLKEHTAVDLLTRTHKVRPQGNTLDKKTTHI